MAACTQDAILDFIEPLVIGFADLWSKVLVNAPKREGLAFGSCYSSCGSCGITNVAGLDTLELSMTGSSLNTRVFFSQCAIRDYALILLEIDATPLQIDTALRVTGGLNNTVFNEAYQNSFASFSGYLLLTVPVDTSNNTRLPASTNFLFTEMTADVVIKARWTPDTLSMWSSEELFSDIPVESLLNKYTETLNAYLKTKVPYEFLKFLQAANATKMCVVPNFVPQVCNLTQGPTDACNICDTCCKCAIQQRCDNECEGCECIGCSSPLIGSLALYSALACMVVFIVLYVRIRYTTK
jgi:hypothetical protein